MSLVHAARCLPGHMLAVCLLVAGIVLPGGGRQAQAQVQVDKPTVIPATPPDKAAPTEMKIGHMTRPVTLADLAGAALVPEMAAQMTLVEGFVETSPTDGKAATQKTVAYAGYTATTLYVAFLCADTNPRLIRSHLARRENILQDDTVSVLLDPFADRRRGVLFSLNPAGVQADAAYTEQGGTDYSYDVVWDSAAAITAKGWVAVFAIPFRSLRFRPAPQGWGVVLMRGLPRNSEQDNWPHISTSIAGTLSQEGSWRGIEGVTGSRNIQLNPYVLGQNEHTLLNLDPAHPYFSSRSVEGTAGGEAKIILRDSFVLDATINPDFSDVESDQPQFTVNQRYPVYFPELRPFFLENANYFSTPIDLLYTRNIVRPEYGVRLTGKTGRTNIGLLAIDDREPGQTFSPDQPQFGKRAGFFVARATEDLGKGSSLGVIYTDEEFAGSFSRVGGVDLTARFNDKWTAQGQTVVSSNLATDSTYAAGPASALEITRQGHSWNMDNNYKDFATGFQAPIGFIQTTDFHYEQNHSTYQWYPKQSIVQNFGIEENQQIAYDHQGNRIYHYSQFDPFVQLARNTTFAPLVGENSDTLGPQDGYALAHSINFTENYVGFVARSSPMRQINVNIVGLRSGNVNYNPMPGAAPSLLNQDDLQALVSIRPFRSLTIDNTYLLDRDHEAHGGQDAYESQTLRTKMNYQFTRAMSARVIVEYDSTLVNPAETSLVRTKQVSTQALLTWLPHPGTAIYIGYNNDVQNLDRSLCSRLDNGSCDPNSPGAPRSSNYLNDGRQFFVKASYLFRF